MNNCYKLLILPQLKSCIHFQPLYFRNNVKVFEGCRRFTKMILTIKDFCYMDNLALFFAEQRELGEILMWVKS